MNLNDIIGNRYGKLVVTSYSRKVKRHHKYFCKCDCGNTIEVFRDNLLNGHKISCANCWKIIKETDFYRYICSDGQDFIFSKEDYNIVSQHRWFIDSHGYPKTNINNSTVLLSRLIMECPVNYFVDHINHDTKDNRRCNLRIATVQQNCYNENVRKNNKCGYKGVSLHSGGKYRADIFVNGKNIYLGLFTTPIEAAKAYDNAARKYHMEFARVNFPINSSEHCCRS
ncbi:MAG: HNH endonuclease [Ruminococcus flavefaciens]|nr:HNH endonuclease [Ruminococcus flavefaciens]MCM1363048.1 HNH endonuclease [Clostridiales bacterium]